MVSVKTEKPVPKDRILFVMTQIHATTVEAPESLPLRKYYKG
ncbi:MAG: DUF1667 domain-containing protein [Ruminococcaceae bacterium]|nr:DUF1667 domain-containing protein [Oscillospiraceae bacterium]